MTAYVKNLSLLQMSSTPISISQLNSILSDPGTSPGSPAHVDNQGNLPTCTRFAIAKAVCDGCDSDTWGLGRSFNFDQGVLSLVLCNEHKDRIGKWPYEFNNKIYQLKEGNTYYEAFMKVEEVTQQLFKSDITSVKPQFKYVLVYRDGITALSSHCVFVRSLEKKIINCINSQGNTNPYPQISLRQPGNVLYSIHCNLQDLSLPPTPMPTPQLNKATFSKTKNKNINRTKSMKSPYKGNVNSSLYRSKSELSIPGSQTSLNKIGPKREGKIKQLRNFFGRFF